MIATNKLDARSWKLELGRVRGRKAQSSKFEGFAANRIAMEKLEGRKSNCIAPW